MNPRRRVRIKRLEATRTSSVRSRDPGLENEQLLALYTTMVRTRVMEERALILQRQGRIGFYVPCTGQEASHVGTAAALRPAAIA